MAEWLARVHFPDGTVRYARYSTVVEAVLSDLYDDFHDKGETDDFGNVRSRGAVKGEPSPADPGAPLSEPQEIIPVRIEVEPNNRTWPALYCARRKQVIGPMSGYAADRVQRKFNLVGRDDQLHLVHAFEPAGLPPRRKLWFGRRREAQAGVDRRAWTLCGEPAAGEIIPFLLFEEVVYDALCRHGEDPPRPAARDLYAEWGQGLVCQRCLLHDQALHAHSS